MGRQCGTVVGRGRGQGWPDTDVPFDHGPGYYLSLWKMAPIWLLFATWVHTTDWVNRDTLALRLNYAFWNSLVTFPFFGVFVLIWACPGRPTRVGPGGSGSISRC